MAQARSRGSTRGAGALPDRAARPGMAAGKAGPTGARFEDGWHSRARRIASPNRDARPPGTAIELVVLHNISLPPGSAPGSAPAPLPRRYSMFSRCSR